MKERDPRTVANILKKHAKAGMGLIISRREFITPKEILELLAALGYAERED